MKPRDLLWLLWCYGCSEIDRRGDHLRIRLERRETTVPLAGANVAPGTIRAIEEDLAEILGISHQYIGRVRRMKT